MSSQRIMAIDFGTQKLGLAIGNALTGTATPLPLFAVRDGVPDWSRLLAIIAEWQPDRVLVGLPLNMNDTESELSTRARKFARRLAHHSRLPISMVDERLSTREARTRLSGNQLHQADAMVACILVESWFYDPQGTPP